MSFTGLALAAAAMFALTLFAVLRAPAGFTGVAASLLILSAHTQFLSEAAGNATRIMGLAVLLLFAIFNKRSAESAPANLLLVLSWFGSLAYGLTFIAEPSGTLALGAGVAFVFSTSLLAVLAGRQNFSSLASSAVTTLSAVVALSVVMYAFAPAVAVHGGTRLRGVFANANTMGFFCSLLVVLLVAGIHVRYRMVVGLLSVAGLLLSGSRASLLAALFACLILSVWHISRGRFVAVAGTLLGVGVFGWVVLAFTDTADVVFRTNNSRDIGEQYVFGYLDLKLFGGVGYGGEIVEIASTPQRWLAQGGYFVAALVILAYVVLLILAVQIGPRTLALAFFGVVNSLFEGWYFAGVSGQFILYWVGVIAVGILEMRQSPQSVPDYRTDAPPGTRPESFSSN